MALTASIDPLTERLGFVLERELAISAKEFVGTLAREIEELKD